MQVKILPNLFTLLGIAGVSTVVLASILTQSKPTEAQTSVRKTIIKLAEPTTRTVNQMQQEEAKFASVANVNVPIPFRPTIDTNTYQQLKNRAAALTSSVVRPPLPNAPAPKVAIDGVNCNGKSDTQGLRPPDTHGAAGTTQFVEVTNSSFTVFSKSSTCPVALKNVSLNSFFGYNLQTIFDPRVVYDTTWNRWIVSAEAFPESATVQRHFIGVSLTSDATGAFFIYNIDVDVQNDGDFWDYPQLGINQDAIIFKVVKIEWRC